MRQTFYTLLANYPVGINQWRHLANTRQDVVHAGVAIPEIFDDSALIRLPPAAVTSMKRPCVEVSYVASD